MRLVSIAPDSAVDETDRAIWLTSLFDLAWSVAVIAGKCDVSLSDAAAFPLSLSDAAVWNVALSDATR